MDIGFLLFEQFHGQADVGSSRIRGHWLIKYWQKANPDDTAEPFKIGRKYDVVVYQKAYWIEHAKRFDGVKILDICDPDFLHWGYRVKQMADLCDAVTCATKPLADFLRKYTKTPVYLVPDRMDLEQFSGLQKSHIGRAKKAVWFGYPGNYPMLDLTISSLVKHEFEELIVISLRRQPYQLPAAFRGKMMLTNIPWTLETVNRDIVQGDVVLNPQAQTARWRFKSNNKTLTAWGLGMPVVGTADELEHYLDPITRTKEAEEKRLIVWRDYDVEISVAEMKTIMIDAYDRKKDSQKS